MASAQEAVPLLRANQAHQWVPRLSSAMARARKPAGWGGEKQAAASVPGGIWLCQGDKGSPDTFWASGEIHLQHTAYT